MRALAPTNHVYGLARLRTEEERRALGSLELDLTRMHEALGRTRVGWREGIRRMLEARAPELVRDVRR